MSMENKCVTFLKILVFEQKLDEEKTNGKLCDQFARFTLGSLIYTYLYICTIVDRVVSWSNRIFSVRSVVLYPYQYAAEIPTLNMFLALLNNKTKIPLLV